MITNKNKSNEEKNIKDINADITALEDIVTVLQSRNNSLIIAIEKILSVPTNLNIAESILQHSTCSVLEKKNNIIFLGYIEQKTISYCKNNFNFNFDLDDFKNYPLSSEHVDECIATGEIELIYRRHRYIENALSKLLSDFIDNPDNYAFFKATISSFQKSEIDRLNFNLESIVEVYFYKTISILAYRLDVYDVALMYHDFVVTTYSGGIIEVSYDSGKYFKSEISAKNTKNINKRWGENNQNRPDRKKKYLKTMREKNFSSAAKAAEYIVINDNEENLAYSTILRDLRSAVNGNFS